MKESGAETSLGERLVSEGVAHAREKLAAGVGMDVQAVRGIDVQIVELIGQVDAYSWS